RCKSDLKFIEAAAHRVTPIATPVVYGESIEDGRTGVIVHDAGELQQRLSWLIADPARGRAMADAARAEGAAKRMLAAQVPARLAWYRDLWARRGALTAALRARVPELAE